MVPNITATAIYIINIIWESKEKSHQSVIRQSARLDSGGEFGNLTGKIGKIWSTYNASSFSDPCLKTDAKQDHISSVLTDK